MGPLAGSSNSSKLAKSVETQQMHLDMCTRCTWTMDIFWATNIVGIFWLPAMNRAQQAGDEQLLMS